MTQRFAESTLARLSDFVAREMGLLFTRERWNDLERGIVAAAPHLGCGDATECARRLMSAPLSRSQVEILAGYLTVGESYFLRDPASYRVAESVILPELIAARRGGDQRIRVWSAGCSTGEEAYSLAILLQRLLPDLEGWRVTVLATDINNAALSQALAGVYGKWSFRGTPPWFKSLYFSDAGEGRYRISEKIRRMVSFGYLNLAEDSYPSLFTNTTAMDLIFCRNVLMYFTRDMARTVVHKLNRSLVEGGFLVVGPVESWPECYQPLQAISFDGVTCYRKPAEGVAPAQPAETAGSERGAVEETGVKVEERGELAALIRSHANRGQLSEAMKLCREALRSHKLDASLHHLEAEILQEQGLFEEARVSLERALFLDPKLVLAHFAQGNLALGGGDRDKARKHLQNALELLQEFAPEEIVPGSEGMSAGRLSEIIRQITSLKDPSPAREGRDGERWRKR